MSVRSEAGLPESISGSQIQELLRALGLQLDDLLRFEIHRGAVEAEVFSRDANGNRFARSADDAATDTIHIPIVWDQ